MSRELAPAWLVSGTDTEIGKTLVACALLHRLRERQAGVVGAKPVSAGGDAQGRNEDVLQLRAASTLAVPAELDNPYALPEPMSPHAAARRAARSIDLARIADAVQRLRERADAVVVEGVGGFLVPLSMREDGGDLALRLRLPVILVVGLRLGCLNHALLTQEAIAARGLRLAGWVANRIDASMLAPQDNLELLRARLRAPCLGVVPHLARADAVEAARHLQAPP